jgi:hypothetical protein
MRALEATLADGLPQPSYFEADLVKVKGLLHHWKMLWSKATPDERKDIMASLFGEVRVRDKTIVSATLADQQYAPLIASSDARRLRLVTPEGDGDEQVGLAPPDGSHHATTTHRHRGCRAARDGVAGSLIEVIDGEDRTDKAFELASDLSFEGVR